MSTFKKYLQIINETKDDMSLANLTSIANLTSRFYIQHTQYTHVKLDDHTENFLKDYAIDAATDVIANPKRKVLNKVKLLEKEKVKLPSGVTEEEYASSLAANFAKVFVVVMIANKLETYFKGMQGENLNNDNPNLSPIWIKIDKDGYHINLDIKNIEPRSWEGNKWGSRREIAKESRERTKEFYNRINNNIQNSLKKANRDAKETSEKIKELNSKQNPPVNGQKPNNRKGR